MSQIHGNISFDRGNANQPVAMAESIVGEANLFGSKQDGDAACMKLLANSTRTVFQTAQGVVQFAVPDGCGADNEFAIRDSLCNSREFAGTCEQIGSADGGTSFTEGRVKGSHDA